MLGPFPFYLVWIGFVVIATGHVQDIQDLLLFNSLNTDDSHTYKSNINEVMDRYNRDTN